MNQNLRHVGRAVAVLRELIRHDAVFFLRSMRVPRVLLRILPLLFCVRRSRGEPDPGRRLTIALTALGPAFVKIGQGLSVRPDLVGNEIADRLADLQDRMPAFPGKEARAIIERELDRPISEIFASFDDDAVAAASIAQVHRATTTDGSEVAVKVLRPDIEDLFLRDLALARWLAGLAERWAPDLRRLRPVEAVDTIIRSVETEMDLRLEAAAADELRENFRDDTSFRVPEVNWALTSRRILTLQWIDAIPIDESGTRADPEEIVASLARVFFLQVFRDGFFHADMHPGNLLVDSAGVIHAVDFGIMGRLDLATRQYLAEMLYGFLSADYRRVARVHFRAGYVPAHHSVDEFAQAARAIAEPILGLPLGQISLARLLAQLFAVTARFDMETQPQLLMLQKTMLVAEGVGRRLCPDTNMWELARPLIESWIQDGSAQEARIRSVVTSLLERLEHLPGIMAEQNTGTQMTAALPSPPRQRESGWFWPVLIIVSVLVTLVIFR